MDIELLEEFFAATLVPLFLKEGNYRHTFSPVELSEELLSIFHQTKDGVHTEILLPYAQFSISQDTILLLGPVKTDTVAKTELQSFLQRNHCLSSKNVQQFEQYLNMIPSISLQQFQQLTKLLSRLLKLDSLTIEVDTQTQATTIQKKSLEKIYAMKDEPTTHNTYAFEQAILQFVQEGNPVGITKLMKQTPYLTFGRIGTTSLRQAQNLFIAAVSLVTRAAIQGGMDIQKAYALSDTYIQEAERKQQASEVLQLFQTANLDFAQQVEQEQLPTRLTDTVHQAIYYIRQHTNIPLRVEDVATAVHMSRSHLSAIFKEQIKMGISEYITQAKLKEACLLLKFTDKPLGEISTDLAFSSQAYFQNVFKKHYGQTPREYRLNRKM